jgi:hypothetical protein
MVLVCSVLVSNLSISAETSEPDRFYDMDDLSPLQIHFMREAYEYKLNYFLSDRWFAENVPRIFYRDTALSFVEGYEFNPDDFSEINFEEFKPASEYGYTFENVEDYYIMVFETFDDLYYTIPVLKNMPMIENVDTFIYSLGDERLYPPNRGDAEKYGTIEVTQEIADRMVKNHKLKNDGDLDNDYKITINDVVRYFRIIHNPQIDLDPVQFYIADIYQDGKINVVDAVVCVNKVIGKE